MEMDKNEATIGQPSKHVRSQMDMAAFQRSEAYHNLLGFINGICTAIQGKRTSSDMHISGTMQKLIDIFDALNKLIDETPAIEQPQRFGNKAYRLWSQKMMQHATGWLEAALPAEKSDSIVELSQYFRESFGNAMRIDYGTGHELSFIFFLCGLFKAEILAEADSVASALRLFNTYLIFARRLQQTYRMEPAGSQGVWALDDYQFMPFIWGSAQLAMNCPFEPSQFLEEKIIAKYKEEYLFIGCIDYICRVKTGHFAEHSNQLWGISSVPSWAKICTGLIKMYEKEILAKFPIIQHCTFGKLMSFSPVKPGATITQARLGMAPLRAPGSMLPPTLIPKATEEKAKPASNAEAEKVIANDEVTKTINST